MGMTIREIKNHSIKTALVVNHQQLTKETSSIVCSLAVIRPCDGVKSSWIDSIIFPLQVIAESHN